MASATVFWLLFGCAAVLAVALAFLNRWLGRLEYLVLAAGLIKGKASKLEEDDVALTTVTTAKKSLRGPRAFPLIGSLHKLGGAGGPFEAFTNMAKEYGDIYEIQLGVSRCVIVSSYKLVKEVLITKGSHFGGRPDFMRFHQLFGGDRNNCKLYERSSFFVMIYKFSKNAKLIIYIVARRARGGCLSFSLRKSCHTAPIGINVVLYIQSFISAW